MTSASDRKGDNVGGECDHTPFLRRDRQSKSTRQMETEAHLFGANFNMVSY